MLQPGAEIELAVAGSAGEARQAAHCAEASAFDAQFAVQGSAAFIRHNVDDSADRIASIYRRSRAAQNFDALGVDQEQVLEKRGSVALRGGGVAKAQAVDRDGRILRAESASQDSREGAGSSQILDLHARDCAERLGGGELGIL